MILEFVYFCEIHVYIYIYIYIYLNRLPTLKCFWYWHNIFFKAHCWQDFAAGKGKVPANINKLLDQAKGALDKLCKDALKILKDSEKIPDQGKLLKSKYALAQKDLGLINHVKMFREMPDERPLNKDTFDKCVYEVAQHVETLNSAIESAKADLRAKNN